MTNLVLDRLEACIASSLRNTYLDYTTIFKKMFNGKPYVFITGNRSTLSRLQDYYNNHRDVDLYEYFKLDKNKDLLQQLNHLKEVDNKKRNNILSNKLNAKHLEHFKVGGGYKEDIQDKDGFTSWLKNHKKLGKYADDLLSEGVQENSFFVQSNKLSDKDFRGTLLDIAKELDQDSILYGKNGKTYSLSDKGLSKKPMYPAKHTDTIEGEDFYSKFGSLNKKKPKEDIIIMSTEGKELPQFTEVKEKYLGRRPSSNTNKKAKYKYIFREGNKWVVRLPVDQCRDTIKPLLKSKDQQYITKSFEYKSKAIQFRDKYLKPFNKTRLLSAYKED